MKIPDYLLADALVGVIAQRLVKKLCPACKKKLKTTAQEMKTLGLTKPAYIYHAQGCQYCNHTGYKGRTAVHEIMRIDKGVKNDIVNTHNIEELREISLNNGLVTLWDSCKRLVLSGDTSIEELMALSIE